MAEGKKSFILYTDQKELFEQLPSDKAGDLIKHVFRYVNDENPESDDLLINVAFTSIKAQLKRDLKKFEKTKDVRSKAGKAGADARWQTHKSDGKRKKSMAKMADNDNDNDNVINIPTFLDFKVYALSKSNNVSSEMLKLKYESWKVNGWKDGNNKPIKNWKVKLLNTLPYLKKTKTDAL